MISSKIGSQCGFGSYPVTEVNNYMIEMPDGVRLSSKLWFPSSTVKGTCFEDAEHHSFYNPTTTIDNDIGSGNQELFPVILEYIPYRKSDFTADRDYRRHSWFSSHGYVALRVDMRGSGDSEGLYFDEYLKQEQDDCINVMKWVSCQPWSNKKVGMIGKSWSGFNGLQVAYCQPPELQAVISVYSTDNRYVTDMHHDGGCIIANGLLNWSAQMFAWNSRVPDPRNCPNWRDMWKERLQKASSPWSRIWLRHQTRDDYWKHASICEDYNKVTCPVLAIGGWKDGYRDSVFRMVEHLPNVKGIVGPWCHEWPDTSKPGPAIEYLKVCLEWFDHHLKGVQNNVMNDPKLRLYVQSHILPNPEQDLRPGKWVALDGWPTSQIKQQLWNGQDEQSLLNTDKVSEKWFHVPFAVGSGLYHGVWLEYGGPFGPSDQGYSDGQCLQFTTNELQQEVCIVGHAHLECRLCVVNHNQGNIAVKLVDVFPTGESSLITYGLLNLTHTNGHSVENVKNIIPSKEFPIAINLHSTTYVIPVGHRLKLCFTSAYWPLMWPSSKATEIKLKQPSLKLPTLSQSELSTYDNPLFNTTNPALGPRIPHVVLDSIESGIQVESNLSVKKHKSVCKSGQPRIFYPTLSVITSAKATETYEIDESDPLTAKAKCVQENVLEYPEYQGGTKTKVLIESTMTADDKVFYLDNSLTTWLNGEVFYQNKWHDEIDRLYV